MMGTKVFRERNGLKLISDERDIEVSAKYCVKVQEWCNDYGIKATLALPVEGSSWAASVWGVNLWRVRDEQQRVMFALKWA